jgi:hypothetical protein
MTGDDRQSRPWPDPARARIARDPRVMVVASRVPQRRPRRVPVLTALLAILLVTSSCSSNSGETGDTIGVSSAVRPFAEVQASDFVFEADPTDPTRGVFRVTTIEPMICAIVWGETDAFGKFNNSLAMNGTGIVEHDVFLPGAEPGRTYWFQVQGSTADGDLYRSDTATFTIPDDGTAATTPPRSTDDDLAIGATVVDVSSEFSSSFAAANAVDGSGTSEWSTDGDGDSAHITVDLGAVQDITGFEFVTRAMADGTAITRTYTVTVDGTTTFGPFTAGTAATPQIAVVATSGRQLRFDVETSTGGNVGAVEVRALGPETG